MTPKGTKDKVLTGYDPSQYRRMLILFVSLSLVNVVAVIFAFYRVGFGLYHAEQALSCVSRAAQCVLSVNETAQEILINCHNEDDINEGVLQIEVSFSDIEQVSEEYRSIDLDKIDANLSSQFEDAYMEAKRYQSGLKDFTAGLQSGERADVAQIANNYVETIEPLKKRAEDSMNQLFEKQVQATYDFFVRSARQFVFVLLFLLLTMTVGIGGISKMRRNARHAAEVIEQEHEHSKRLRQKTVNIAYSNILTGFKNFYGLEEDLSGIIGKREFTIALCSYNRFSQINEIYGRGRTDEFITLVSQTLKKEFGEEADIYSTGTDEFCFLFRKRTAPQDAEMFVQRVVGFMSRNYTIDDVMIQRFASGCFYVCSTESQDNFAQLFCTLDRAMSVAKAQNAMTGENTVVNVNALS